MLVLSALVVLALSPWKIDGICTAPGSPTYYITFQSMWSASRQPGLFPSGAHWSALIGASHNDKYIMWRPGQKASPGVQLVAERGQTTTLYTELTTEKTNGNVLEINRLSSNSGAGVTVAINVKVDANHSLVSAVTMMAPSPDWFIGIRDVDTCSGNIWTNFTRTISFVYDSGTDSATTFIATNNPTSPPLNIRLLTNDSSGEIFAGKSFLAFGVITVGSSAAAAAAQPTVESSAAAQSTVGSSATAQAAQPAVGMAAMFLMLVVVIHQLFT